MCWQSLALSGINDRENLASQGFRAPAVVNEPEHMPNYRAYIIGLWGHFIRAEILESANDDDEALVAARRLVDGHDVELWDGGRHIALLKPPHRE